MMDHELITATLDTLTKGDTVDLRIERPSGFVSVAEYEVKRVNDRRQELNGHLFVEETNTDKTCPNKYRIFVTDDGVFVGQTWSPSDAAVTAVAVDGESLSRPEYHIEVSKNAEGEITESRLVRDDEVTTSAPTASGPSL